MARVEKAIHLSAEEENILSQARDILKEIKAGLDEYELITTYNNHELILDILEIVGEIEY